MANTIELKVPDLGGSHDVPVIEILVKVGDTVAKDQSLLTLESDKATMDIPASQAGTIVEIKVKIGDELNDGSVIALIEAEAGASASAEKSAGDKAAPAAAKPASASAASTPATPSTTVSEAPAPAPVATSAAPKAAADSGRKADIECQLVVLGSGPGGYTAAFRGADIGLDTVLVERYAILGGVCLNVGCIPSKALLHAAAVIDEAEAIAAHGITFGKPTIDLDKLRSFKEKVVGKLTGGLAQMAKARKVRTVTGVGTFISPNEMEVQTAEGTKLIRFQNAIIAAGSQSVKLPSFPWDDERVIDSTGALELRDVPKTMLVVGGGIIGLEMATVYARLGSEVTVVELADQLMPGADLDLVKPLQARIAKRYKGIHLKTKVVEAKATKAGIEVTFEGESIPETKVFDRVLVSVGRSPNGNKVGADKAGVEVTDRGFIPVDRQMRTNVKHIFAIGDLVGQPMLAHKATHEAKVAAEAAAGEKSFFDARVIPSVAYTDPEIAWVGVTEREAKEKGLKIGVGKFPWAASGRAIGIDRTEGFTKLLFDEETHRIVGAGIVGVHAGDLISELALAIEMGAEAGDIGRTVHPHPTLGESVGMAAEVYEGTITDLYIPKKK
ncbi:dihydrolipoyl dehydrogenase [Luteibacter rhizovicinus DSM 16549]|uniref:Dihydrolipoyl dehydrogenase n=1 Tax=Luteibacter rhizovicinus DSM 16549 TaxID=1440763 RepID=A0A0G9HBL5_9GAMM|nr:dihydrolipoyl dehydrogenase [Luteibacter rhizovicinus]APG04229.1 dihydrolipoyl dehydrogenase [Luteibacter rhizovicinus DSM 16549]KLD66851.1 dihydrolipoamide dehydrogenase [Luteibacter rhizovicinus DSM 16549]